MSLIVVGLSHKTAPLELREKLAFNPQAQKQAYELLRRQSALSETVLLSTCNRVELYAWAEQAEPGLRQASQFLLQARGGGEDLRRALYQRQDDEALWHLLQVSASLDSMVLGEAQILGQVKEAYEWAVENKAVKANFHGLFHRVFRAAKEVRTRTDIGRHSASVASVSVELAERLFQDLKSKCVLLLGAGEMGRLTAQHLKGAGASRVLVVSRGQARAEELARGFQGRALPAAQMEEALAEADIVVACTSAEEYLVGPEILSRALGKRHYRPMLLVDLSVPRNIDPAVDSLDKVYLYNLDHLQKLAEEHRERRLASSREAKEMLRGHLEEILAWMKATEAVPVIRSLTAKAERLRQAEFEKNRNRLGHLGPKDLARVEAMTKSLMNKWLNAPLSQLRHASRQPESLRDRLALLEEIFDLKKEEP